MTRSTNGRDTSMERLLRRHGAVMAADNTQKQKQGGSDGGDQDKQGGDGQKLSKKAKSLKMKWMLSWTKSTKFWRRMLKSL